MVKDEDLAEDIIQQLEELRKEIERSFDMDIQGLGREVKQADKDEQKVEQKLAREGACEELVDVSRLYVIIATMVELLARMGNDISNIEKRLNSLEGMLDKLMQECGDEGSQREAKEMIDEAENRIREAEKLGEEHPTVQEIIEKLREID